ncbi:MAG: fibrinogen-like YCDxxxxGGGW domain-containing protein [Candidatus Nanoarchaeia archaeon]
MNYCNNRYYLKFFSLFSIVLILFLPSTFSANWFDTNYELREQINITTGSEDPFNGYENYTVRIIKDTTDSSLFLPSNDDVRVVYWNGTHNRELDRQIKDNATANTQIIFRLQEDIATSSTVSDYYLYYSNPSATNPPENYSNVYLWYDDASVDRESDYTQGRVDNSVHGGNWGDSISWNSGGYYSFDTGDNFGDSFRPTGLDERDVYIEYEHYQTNAYSIDMTSGPMTRWAGSGAPGSETATDMYYYEMGESLIETGSYDTHDDVTRDGRAGSVALADGTLGFFPTEAWIRLGLATWGGGTSVGINTYYQNESGGWGGYRQSGTDTDSARNTNSGQFGFWLQQDAGRVDNIIARRYIEPEPNFLLSSPLNYSSKYDIQITNASTTNVNIVERNSMLNVTAVVSCSESFLNTCGDTTLTLEYNDSATSFSSVSTTDTTPLWTAQINPQNCIVNATQTCEVSWLVNVTGLVDSSHILQVNALSNESSVSSINSSEIDVLISGDFAMSFNISSYTFPLFTQGTGKRNVSIDIEAVLGDNTNIQLSCESGDCSQFTQNFTNGISLNQGESSSVNFTCLDSSAGEYSAVFNVTSDEYNSSSKLTLNCEVEKVFGPVEGSFTNPLNGTITNVAQDNLYTVSVEIDCTGECGTIRALLVENRGKTGLTSSDPADSGWQIAQDYPYFESGVYWIQTEQMSSPEQIYVDMEYDGGGWMLIGRGRDGWSFSNTQQGTFSDVAGTPNGTSAFSPAHYSATFVDELLNSTSVSNLVDGVRVRRATTTDGSTFQEGIWEFDTLTSWSWDFDQTGGIALSDYTLDGVSYGAQDTRDARSSATDTTRMRTAQDGEHNNVQGFQFGDNECAGTNTPENYLWEYISECNALPFTQVFVNPHYRENSNGRVSSVSSRTPVYMLNQNPQNCSVVNDGSCSFSFDINSTGSLDERYNLSVVFVSNITRINISQAGIITLNITNVVPPTITLELPTNNSKLFPGRVVNFTFYVTSSTTNNTCDVFLNSVLETSLPCQNAQNTSTSINISSQGNNDWYVNVTDETFLQAQSNTFSFISIFEQHKRAVKRVAFDSTTLYVNNVIVENLRNFLDNVTNYEFIDTTFLSGSYSPSFPTIIPISGVDYTGELIQWSTSTGINTSINYSVVGTGNYSVIDLFIVGVE